MVDFTHGYTPPGVYIEEDPTPLVSTTGLPPTRVAIVGRSAGHQTNTEQILLSDTAVRLSKRGIDTSGLTVTTVITGTPVAAADFQTSVVQGATTDPADTYIDLSRTNTASVAEGTMVFVTYNYTDPDFYSAKSFTSFEDVKAAYGAPLNLNAQALGDENYQPINSPLTLAAQIAFQNGAGQVTLVATQTAATSTSAQTRTALAAAYEKLATDYATNVVVPLTDGIATADAAGVGLDLKQHLESTSADGFFRVGVLGFDPAVSTPPDTLVTTSGFSSKRVMLAYANAAGMQIFNGNTNQTLAVGHQYLAAAYGGRMAALPVQKALTKEQLNSFSGVAGTPLSNALKNQYAAAGVAITEIDRRNRLVVRHGCTTDKSNINTAEISVVRAKDSLVAVLQTGTDDSGLIGQPIDEHTLTSVKSVVSGLLEHCVSTSVVVSYANLAVRQASLDPSVIEVRFEYKPAYPLNYILISFAINVATGDTTLTDVAA